jgi:vWA-MoxR associated protein C-terminal domain/Effector-associated domain 9/vWA-MoxR associated protein middle region (VMAP-M) 1
MAKVYKSKLMILFQKEVRLDALKKDLESNVNQLNYTRDEVERGRLDRQRSIIEGTITEVASAFDKLVQEIMPGFLDSLLKIMKLMSLVKLIEVLIKCQGSSYRTVPSSIETLLLMLNDIPGSPGETKPLIQFVRLLTQDSSLTEFRVPLEDWIRRQCEFSKGYDVETHSLNSEILDNYLMIAVKPKPPNGYVVCSAIVRDLDPFGPKLKSSGTQLKIANPIVTKIEIELKSILCELSFLCVREYGIPLSDLTVQWFLPLELMNLPVEHWDLPIGRQKYFSGRRCKAIAIRSYERQFSDDYDLSSGDWEKYWNRFLDDRNAQCHASLDEINPKKSEIEVKWQNTNIKGCQFLEHENYTHKENLWDSLLAQGVSIALWMRYLPSCHNACDIVNNIPLCLISELPTTLTTHRQKVLPLEANTPITDLTGAAHLSLLWDNPFRPFPTIEYRSA